MSDLKIGDEILAMDSNNQPVFTPVLLFLDRDINATRMYYKITTVDTNAKNGNKRGHEVTLTGSHLIFVIEYLTSDFNVTLESKREVFARQVIPGQFVSIVDDDGQIKFEKVISVEVINKFGVYAPLTAEGNLIVNQVLVSCYADINDQSLAHMSFLPLRIMNNFKMGIKYLIGREQNDVISNEVINEGVIKKRRKEFIPNGIHWYPKLLQKIAKNVLPIEYLD